MDETAEQVVVEQVDDFSMEIELALQVDKIELKSSEMMETTEEVGLNQPDESTSGINNTNQQEVKRQSIQRCIRSLVHVCRCQEQQCRQPFCMKMKRVIGHSKVCKQKTSGGCPICKQLMSLCCYHAKHCNEVKCLLLFCPNIKQKLKQQDKNEQQQAENAVTSNSTGARRSPIEKAKVIKLKNDDMLKNLKTHSEHCNDSNCPTCQLLQKAFETLKPSGKN